MTTYTIEVERIDPPIPVRDYDFRATFKGYDMDDPIGYGPTEWDALNNLLDMALLHSTMFKEEV